ncbi:flagellar export chaperone FlgN [uncultured Massilia sp.]|uniref:flagellar export chaperone FlgN n=1 Tax=uncultured Massilia sp. TaxID=169973 RepID=UPI0025D7DEDD|nr:flagellar export chaperone FlgN [uncultured Massilia sp.]
MTAARMTRDQAVARLLDGIQDDLGACGAIRALLERQFEAALRHRGAELAALAGQLMPELDAMEQRRVQRVQLVRALLGPEATMDDLFPKLDAPRRAAASGAWRQLEELVRDCKDATSRNGNLMAEQYSTMQRLLHGEDQTYAPR